MTRLREGKMQVSGRISEDDDLVGSSGNTRKNITVRLRGSLCGQASALKWMDNPKFEMAQEGCE